MMNKEREGVPDAGTVLGWLQAESDPETLAAMGPRFGIHTDRAFGVPMASIKRVAKRLGTNHELALELWATGWYEARIVAAMVDDPAAVTGQQMDDWCAGFDNWAIVDTVCFNLFDCTSDRWAKVEQWASSDEEFTKRAAFALLWSLALHDRDAGDDRLEGGLRLIEQKAGDGRRLVDKAIGMALRAIGKRRPSLRESALAVAERLAKSDDPAVRRVGRQAVKELR